MNIFIFSSFHWVYTGATRTKNRVDTVIERFNAKVCASTGWRNSEGGFL